MSFKAKALNGTPPITFTWDFGDGSPPVTGELAQHLYDKLGRFDAVVVAKDANGETDRVLLALLVADVKEYVDRLQLDPKKFENWEATPSPAATP